MQVKIYSAMRGIDEIDIEQHVFVVMDILRASNTIICLMESGISDVKVVGEVEEAYALKEHGYVLMGERLGRKIPGFDFDNSPYRAIHHVWNGEKVALKTTNGTRALVAVQDGFSVVIGSFRNIDAVCRHVKSLDRPIALLPVGDRGEPMLEDELCARAMLSRIRNEPVDWQAVQKAILEKAEAHMGVMGETYRKDAMLSTAPNETDIIPVLCDGLVVKANGRL